jgi:hypothetical protein
MLQAMAGDPTASRPAAQQTRYSADGFWWWNGAEWRPAYSQDRLWRWTGQAWEPTARPSSATGSGSGAGGAVGIVVGMVLGTIVLVGLMASAILYFAGTQISNVFSNLVGTPNSP